MKTKLLPDIIDDLYKNKEAIDKNTKIDELFKLCAIRENLVKDLLHYFPRLQARTDTEFELATLVKAQAPNCPTSFSLFNWVVFWELIDKLKKE